RPKIRDRKTGQVATDPQGRPVTVVRCALLGADESSEEDGSLELVHTVAEVGAIKRGTPVVLSGLVARPYAFKDASGEQRAGVTFGAASIGPVPVSSGRSSS